MRKYWLVVFFVLFSVSLVPGEENFFQQDSITSLIKISGSATVKPTSSPYRLESATVNLSFVPLTSFQQQVLSLETLPAAELGDGLVSFSWRRPKASTLDFSVMSKVSTSSAMIKVTESIPFPLRNLPEEVMRFTKPSGTVDSGHPAIITLANTLAEGEADLYAVVFNLAAWSKKHIEYDLSSLTASVTQKASWVLENRQGVCDELTNLFIAMNRALGIPAKFVSGLAFSDAVTSEDGFGPHGWAEVYFPGYGWVPFDVTYGEFGALDEFHIKLKEALDANEASTKYQWLGKEVTLATNPLQFSTTILEKKGGPSDVLEIKVIPEKNNLGFGSYNFVEVLVENLEDYYIGTILHLATSPEVEVIGDKEQAVLLGPGESKRLYWTLEVSSNLKSGFLYTFPVQINSMRNIEGKGSFDVREDGFQFSLEHVEEVLAEAKEEEEKIGSRQVRMGCVADKEEMYLFETGNFSCTITNSGNVFLSDVAVCYEDTCKTLDLGISQSAFVSFAYTPVEAGLQQESIKARGDSLLKVATVELLVLDEPAITIVEVKHPVSVTYKQPYDVSFVLSKDSASIPQDISLQVKPLEKEWKLDQLPQDRKFALKLVASNLDVGRNEFEVLLTYHDKRGNEYSSTASFDVHLTDVTFIQRISLFFSSIPRRIMSLF